MKSIRLKRYSLEKGAHIRRIYIVIAIVSLMILVAAILVESRDTRTVTQNQATETSTSSQPKPSLTLQGKYLFSGTIVMARAVERAANGDVNQPFSKFDTFNPAQYDGWLADLECPATNKEIPYRDQVENLQFNCGPKWFPALSNYFTMFNLANNHTGDMGTAGFAETQKNLDAAGFQVVGSYDPSSKEDACEVMALPVRMGEGNIKGTLPIAFCAFHYFFRKPLAGEMDVVSEYANVMPVFGLMHAGVEYRPNADDTQKEIARTLVDKGADFVIGNSPHWVQESEVYKGKPIFYSTGNFIFDQLEPEEQRGLSIAVDVSLQTDENVDKWLELGKQCAARRDKCLALAKQQGLKKIQPKLVYTPVGSSGGNRKLTQLADPKLQASIEDRLKWSQTKAALGQ